MANGKLSSWSGPVSGLWQRQLCATTSKPAFLSSVKRAGRALPGLSRLRLDLTLVDKAQTRIDYGKPDITEPKPELGVPRQLRESGIFGRVSV